MDRDRPLLIPDGEGPTTQGRQAARDAVWSGGGQAVAALLGVVWLFTVPRTLGPAAYGLYILFSSLVDFHTTACSLGINNAFAYHFPRFRCDGALAPFTCNYAMAVGGASAVGGVIVVLAASALGGQAATHTMIFFVVAAAMLQAANAVLGGVLYGQNEIRLYSLRFPLQQLLALVAVLGGGLAGGLEGALAGMALATALTTIWMLHVVKPWRGLSTRILSWSQMRGPLAFGLFAIFGTLGGLTITRGGNIILAGVGRSHTEVGNFAVAVGFVLQGVIVLAALGVALTPGLAGLRSSGDEERAQEWAARATRYQAMLGLVGIAFVALVGKHVLQVALGPRFGNVFPITLLSICGLLPLTQTGLANQFAVAWGHPRLNLENWGVLGGVFVTVGALLAHAYGDIGMAAALVAAAWVAGIYTGLRLRLLGGPNIWNLSVLKLIVLATPGALLLRPETTFGLSLALFAGFVVYFTAGCFVIGAITPRDAKEILVSLKRH